MPSLNFEARFAGLVSSGRKTQTIRAPRKCPIKVGDTLHLFTGQRHPGCRKLGIGRCTGVQAIKIDESTGFEVVEESPVQPVLRVRRLSDREAARLARADGFSSTREMVDWFRDRHGLPFRGHVIRWVLA